jgi:hypothetical protein
MTARVDAVDVQALVEAVRALDGLLRAAQTADGNETSRLAADAAALGAALDAYRAELARVAAVDFAAEPAPASMTRGVAVALAATDLDAAVRALRDATAPVADDVAPAALRVRLTLAFRLCAAALAGLAGREAP